MYSSRPSAFACERDCGSMTRPTVTKDCVAVPVVRYVALVFEMSGMM